MRKSICYFLFLSFIFLNVSCAQTKKIAPNDSRIHISGSNYVSYKNNELILHRHSDKIYQGTTLKNLFNPLKARSASGILISFKTASPKTKVFFKIAKGWHKNPIFSILQNDTLIENKSFKYEDDKIISFEIKTNATKNPSVYTIALPLRTDVHFLGLELPKNDDLIDFKEEKKPIYVAFGNSITHGTGQQTTPQTYAYQLAKNLHWELFNTAVGGSKTSKVMADMIANDFKKIDYMTILIGFNDYNGQGVDTLTFAKRYRDVLSSIRAKHSETIIYAITMTTTKSKHSKKSGIPVEDFRKVIRDIVRQRQANGDSNIYLIEGNQISEEADLNDNVHLSVKGAQKFAKRLTRKIEKINHEK